MTNWRALETELTYLLRRQGCKIREDDNGDVHVACEELHARDWLIINVSELAQALAPRIALYLNQQFAVNQRANPR